MVTNARVLFQWNFILATQEVFLHQRREESFRGGPPGGSDSYHPRGFQTPFPYPGTQRQASQCCGYTSRMFWFQRWGRELQPPEKLDDKLQYLSLHLEPAHEQMPGTQLPSFPPWDQKLTTFRKLSATPPAAPQDSQYLRGETTGLTEDTFTAPFVSLRQAQRSLWKG